MNALSKLKARNDAPRLHLLIVADTHIDEKHPQPILPQRRLRCAIKDAQQAQTKVDAFVVIGDVTSRGSEANWAMTKAVFQKTGLPAARTLLAIGNHDTWSDEGGLTGIERYLTHSAEITGEAHEKTYFSTVINGVHLIFLGSESDFGCEAQISDEQVAWLTAEMETASQSGFPILVFCHQPVNLTHGLPRTSCRAETDTDPLDGGIGIDSDKVRAVLERFDNVFYFSGHSHMGYAGENRFAEEGYASFETAGGITFVNLPSLACGNHHAEQGRFGLGLQLEVYEHEIILTPRDVQNHCAVGKLAVQDGKPYFSKNF